MIFNEARSTSLYYIGRKSSNGWIFQNDEHNHKISYKGKASADAELKNLQTTHPDGTFRAFSENDPEVLGATQDTAIGD